MSPALWAGAVLTVRQGPQCGGAVAQGVAVDGIWFQAVDGHAVAADDGVVEQVGNFDGGRLASNDSDELGIVAAVRGVRGQSDAGCFGGRRRGPGPDELRRRVGAVGDCDLGRLFQGDRVCFPDPARGQERAVPVAVSGLEQNGSGQLRRNRLEWLKRITGRAGFGSGEREVPGWSGEGVESHMRWVVCRVGISVGLGPDKNDIVGDCSAVEAVDAQADWSGREPLAIDSPGGFDRLQSQIRGLEALVGEPEGDRRDRGGDIDDDGLVDVETKISARERCALARLQTGEQVWAAGGERGELALRARAAEPLADGAHCEGGGGQLAGHRRSGVGQKRRRDEDQPDWAGAARDFHDTRSRK